MKSHDVTVVYRHLNLTPDLAKKAEKAGVDIIVATGMDEGGTLPAHNIGTFSIVPLIVDSVKIPVMAAGGIADRRHSMQHLRLVQKELFVELFSFQPKKPEHHKMSRK